MKPTYRIENASGHVVQEVGCDHVIIYPYMMHRLADGRVVPLWWQREGFGGSMLLRSMCFGKRISQNQTLENWMLLEPEGKSRRANMEGLYELLHAGVLPPGGDGGVVLYVDGAGRCTVWSDSVGAAKRFILSVLDEVGMKAAYASIGEQERYKRLLKELE